MNYKCISINKQCNRYTFLGNYIALVIPLWWPGSAVEELQHCCNLLAAGTCSQGEQYVSIRLEDALVMNNKVDARRATPVPQLRGVVRAI